MFGKYLFINFFEIFFNWLVIEVRFNKVINKLFLFFGFILIFLKLDFIKFGIFFF